MTYREFHKSVAHAAADYSVEFMHGVLLAADHYWEKVKKYQAELLATPADQRGIHCIDNSAGAGHG
jgi:hypothetical protein